MVNKTTQRRRGVRGSSLLAGLAIVALSSAPASAHGMGTEGALRGNTSGESSSAAAPCWQNSRGWYCNNTAPVIVYERPTTLSDPAGTVLTTTSRFICRGEGQPHHQGPHFNRWEKVPTDEPPGSWGWMLDSQISSETNPLPEC